MFLVKTHIQKSDIEGFGVFSSQKINKGDLVWVFDPRFDRIYTPEEVSQFPTVAQEHIFKCGFLDKDQNVYILGIDYDIFTNHSDESNLIEELTSNGERTPNLIATRDIDINEELTQNYYSYDDAMDIKRKMDLNKT